MAEFGFIRDTQIDAQIQFTDETGELLLSNVSTLANSFFRVISCEEGKALAESWNAAFMESSAKENQVGGGGPVTCIGSLLIWGSDVM